MQTHFTVVDLETTGLDPKRDKIIEIGAIQVENGEIKKTFQTFVNPGRKLSEKVKELTGIMDEDLEHAPSIETVIKDFLEFVDDECLVGHNILFDFSFLKRAAVNCGLTFERGGIDTLRLSRVFLLELQSRTLPALCQHFQIDHNPHRALDDVFATYMLYKKLKELFYEKNPEIFQPQRLIYQVKKEGPVTAKQLEQIQRILLYHQLTEQYNCPDSPDYMDFQKMTKNEASRFIDLLILRHGRCL